MLQKKKNKTRKFSASPHYRWPRWFLDPRVLLKQKTICKTLLFYFGISFRRSTLAPLPWIVEERSGAGTMPPRWHSAPTPRRPTPARLDPLTDTLNVKTSEHSLWCGECSFCLGSQTSSPVFRVRRRPLEMQTGRITAGRRAVVRMMVMKMIRRKTTQTRVICRRPQTWRIKLSLNSGSWQPPGLRRCTKPFLPRRSQTRGEGGTAREPLPNKRTPRSMRRASPCSIDSRETH